MTTHRRTTSESWPSSPTPMNWWRRRAKCTTPVIAMWKRIRRCRWKGWPTRSDSTARGCRWSCWSAESLAALSAGHCSTIRRSSLTRSTWAAGPLNSWPSFIPVIFEMTVLVAALSAVLGMLAMNGLPRPHHPLFAIPQFDRATPGSVFHLHSRRAIRCFTRRQRASFSSGSGQGGHRCAAVGLTEQKSKRAEEHSAVSGVPLLAVEEVISPPSSALLAPFGVAIVLLRAVLHRFRTQLRAPQAVAHT